MDLPSEYTEEEIFAFLKKRQHTLEGVAISGGEPTLQPDLAAFIRKIRSAYGLKIKLDSNGCRPDVLAALMEEGLLDYIAMDIKSGPSGYARCCGRQELDLKPYRESIRLLLSGGIPYEFRTTVVRGLHSEADFQELGPLIEGAERYYLQSYQDSGNVLDREAGFAAFSREELLRFRDIVAPYVKQAELRGVEY